MGKEMIFIFNNLSRLKGIWTCNDINSSGIKRFTTSPLVNTLNRYKQSRQQFKNFNIGELVFDSYNNRKKYNNIIIPAGVTHSPHDWTGYTDLDKKYDPYMKERASVFFYIDHKLLGMLRKRKAFLLLDQSHEGYHTDWIFNWFHDGLKKYEIDADRIIYVTGNLSVESQYSDWCNVNTPASKMCVIPHIQFEELIYDAAVCQKESLPDFEKQFAYKNNNLNEIKLYNCFQKRPRPHRIWMFYYLYRNNLLDLGINSMNKFTSNSSYYDGKFLCDKDYKDMIDLLPIYPRYDLNEIEKSAFEGPMGTLFERDLYINETLDSWISIVSEASFAEDTCFISEKTFKPIAARHPFIMCGNKFSLKYLKGLGYKTFSGFIDETYDDLDTWNRYQKIIDEIIKLKNMTNTQKLEWFHSQKEILDHNFNILKYNTTEKLPDSVLKIQQHIGG